MDVTFEVGDVWDDGIYTRAIIAVYDKDVLVAWDGAGRGAGVLPKRLFAEGRCGRRMP